MDASATRVALADDDVLLREGLASLLTSSGFEVVGQAGDAPGLLALVREQKPDLVVVDIRMPPGHATEGLEAARVIREEAPGTGILLLSAHVEVEQAMELIAAGQRVGYLLKSRVVDVGDFVETLRRIAQGGSVVDPSLVQELIAARRRDDPLETLTEREREVLALMAEGRSNAGIAHRLWITEGTVEKHVRSIMARMRLPETEDDHRRVLAVLTFLESR
ncbi:response regulator transcription factor [Nonomuraea sp. NPDC050786]|uniref:response regulator transcription factor n=1 Tax=Nonomuraea sp. NPDC050786 TaxID=3154840 RepID=UPI0033E6CEA5